MIWKTNHLKIICLEQQGCFPYSFVYLLEDLHDLKLPFCPMGRPVLQQAPSLQSTRSNTRALQPPLGWGCVLLGVAKSHENMYMSMDWLMGKSTGNYGKPWFLPWNWSGFPVDFPLNQSNVHVNLRGFLKIGDPQVTIGFQYSHGHPWLGRLGGGLRIPPTYSGLLHTLR